MQKKIPMRKCVGCRASRPKRELVRVVCTPDGRVELDTTGKLAGRGAYICPDRACLDRAIKTRALERAFADKAGHTVKLDEAMLSALAERVEKLGAKAEEAKSEKAKSDGAKTTEQGAPEGGGTQ